jgi:predicted transcriptional regulator
MEALLARKKSVPLTEAEQRLMEIVWTLGDCTVGQIIDAMPTVDRPAYNTVQTIMKILETKGYVRHRADGRAFIYTSVVERAAAARTALSYVTDRFFGGSPARVALNLIDDDRLSPADLEALKRLLDDGKRER